MPITSKTACPECGKYLDRNLRFCSRYCQRSHARTYRIEDGIAYLKIDCYEIAVDEIDLPILRGHSWWIDRGKYAATTGRVNGKRKTLRLHRLILGCSESEEVDHRDGNGFNNRRNNLRIANRSENSRNRAVCYAHASRFRGVIPHGDRWAARILVNRKRIWLGKFATEEEAARAYDAAALQHSGDFARTNFSHEQAQAGIVQRYTKRNGVHPAANGKFFARWVKNGRLIHVGTFNTEEEAELALRHSKQRGY